MTERIHVTKDSREGIACVSLAAKKHPIDYRVYQRENDDKTKNDHFHDMLQRAKQRGFTPHYVLMDAWYSSINSLKFITKKLKWNFICNLKSNRQVSMNQGTYSSLADLDLAEKQVSPTCIKIQNNTRENKMEIILPLEKCPLRKRS